MAWKSIIYALFNTHANHMLVFLLDMRTFTFKDAYDNFDGLFFNVDYMLSNCALFHESY